jgi:hypothetical protein
MTTKESSGKSIEKPSPFFTKDTNLKDKLIEDKEEEKENLVKEADEKPY